MEFFCLSFRLLDNTFHGRGDHAMLEWPPSPLRAFQALTNAAAAISPAREIWPGFAAALEWLERQEPPVIQAPPGTPGTAFQMSVPSNAMDVVAAAWARGNESNTGDANPATHRSMKNPRPTRIEGSPEIHYLWRVIPEDESRCHLDELTRLGREITRLGWGVDMAVGDSSIVSAAAASRLPGERWMPHGAASSGLRVPTEGTLTDATRRHKQFLNRLSTGLLVPPGPLTVFERVEYRLTTDRRGAEMATFILLDVSGTRRASYDTAGAGLTIAGRLKDATKRAAQASRWTSERVDTFVLGHGQVGGDGKHVAVGTRRFAYWPLPTVESRAGSTVSDRIHRVAVTSFDATSVREIAWARRALAGQTLVNEHTARATALLSLTPEDGVIRRYTQRSASWATVTPVVLPGHDHPNHYRRRAAGSDATAQRTALAHLHDRVDSLLRKALRHAGISEDLARVAELEWRAVGFWPGTDRADRYGVPDHLHRFPRFHVRLVWRDSRGSKLRLPGPLCIGGGRFYGLGLFAAAD